MYDFKIETDLTAFDNFVKANKGSYLQCSKWPEVKTSWGSRFYSGFFGEERVLTCLVLSRVLPVAGEIWYIPCGPLCDYKNESLQKEFTDFIKSEMKKAGATCLIVDPLISLRISGETQEDGVNAHKLLTACGYSLNPKIETYTYKHPVQTYIPLRDDDNNIIPSDKILKNCEKGVRYSVRIGTTRGLESKLYTYEDVKKNPQIMADFMSVMQDTSNRNDFVSRDGDYCKNLMEKFEDSSDIIIVYYNKKKDCDLENERRAKKQELLTALETAPEKKIKGIKGDIEAIDSNTKNFEIRMGETKDYPDDAVIPVAGGFTLRYGGVASCLFGGTRNIIRNNTRSSHYLNYLRICKSIECGCDYHDLGYVLVDSPDLNSDGTLGEMKPNKDFVGINEFKLSFGADYMEFIGEYVLVGNKLKYYLYSNLMPKAKKFKMKLVKLIRR